MTRLMDLQPRWVTPNYFIFKCPHCGKAWLSCKNIPMMIREQREVLEAIDLSLHEVAPCNPETIWNFSTSDFATISVTPSINAEASGCWHGYITNGVCQ
jgi:hypothetical protein